MKQHVSGCNADFTFYPATGHKRLGPKEDNFTITLSGGTLATAHRMESDANCCNDYGRPAASRNDG
jgi:hypothetical protein